VPVRGRALLFPYHGPDCKPLRNFHAPFVVARLLDASGDETRFLQPRGTQNHVYLDPTRPDWVKLLADPTRQLAITEGPVKAIAAMERGLVCIAISGVWSWRTHINGKSELLPELARIAWSGRTVQLAFDSDVDTNPQVQAALHALARVLTALGAFVVQVCLPSGDGGAKQGLDDYLVGHSATDFEKLDRAPVTLMLNPAAPLDTADVLVGATYMQGEARTLHHREGAFHRWSGTHYAEVPRQTVRDDVYRLLAEARCVTKSGNIVPFNPTARRVDDVLDALRSVVALNVPTVPAWIDGRAAPPAAELFAVRNGLLHVPTRTLHAHSPLFFNTAAADYDYRPDAPPPARFLRFLASVFPDDAAAIATPQEIFDYLFVLGLSLDKIFLIVGPTRCGKGTLARLLQALMGAHNVVWPTLDSLAGRFGKQQLIGKALAIVGDAHQPHRGEEQRLVELLLGISGRDGQSIDRKHLPPVPGPLLVRFVMLGNTVPTFADAGGALAGRFITLAIRESWLGREDPALEPALHAERSAILNWLLAAGPRLARRGRFVQPRSASDEQRLLGRLATPVKAFVTECCTLGKPLAEVLCKDVFAAWCEWCRKERYKAIGSEPSFEQIARSVDGCVSHKITTKKHRVKGEKDGPPRDHYVGIELSDEARRALVRARSE
jgi:putative DNA primase/helicase